MTSRPHAIDPARLAFVDEHTIAIDAGVERVWREVLAVADDAFAGEPQALFARFVLGCEDSRSAGARPLAPGSKLVGSRVVSADRPHELALVGRHRFSRYALTFRLQRTKSGGTLLRAETRADFPGLHGRAYRALVIGSRGHVLVVRRMLGAVKRRAQAASKRAGARTTRRPADA